MTQFLKANQFEYHISGGYIPRVDLYEVRFDSTFADARNPEDKRKLLQLVLSKTELSLLIGELQNILSTKND